MRVTLDLVARWSCNHANRGIPKRGIGYRWQHDSSIVWVTLEPKHAELEEMRDAMARQVLEALLKAFEVSLYERVTRDWVAFPRHPHSKELGDDSILRKG